ncbi:hypothetical protein TVNIR_1915 [Thioalkalivibrio nitratireducens DSM 14787]|uniref:Type II secretion system protein GspC N-terminal domain-containing protein n=1 Tax=Thioalkalivibrio nitratireducens (strain DSM 14787 / UNIQEM 213 / ALEN2) TaxID=1255043 RepID=L0DYY5_THIND|nr:hypothetical protein [Thioalkalivibrio nitratireducens]AGA33576.1 hypothetical protein TVNIR_1915 [Thioalkalivibrio nitratireducens DSM 14787]
MTVRGVRVPLALVALLLLVALAVEAWLMHRWYEERRDALLATVQRELPAVAPADLALPVLPELAPALELRDRPLFVPGRRPRVDEAEAVPAPLERSPEAWVLTSTVIAPEGRFAIVRDRESGRSFVLREGDARGDWVLEAVAADQVELRSQAGTMILPLRPERRTGEAARRIGDQVPDGRLEEIPGNIFEEDTNGIGNEG